MKKYFIKWRTTTKGYTFYNTTVVSSYLSLINELQKFIDRQAQCGVYADIVEAKEIC